MTKPKPNQFDDLWAALFLFGVAMALAGVACYDWRAGLIAAGATLAYGAARAVALNSADDNV